MRLLWPCVPARLQARAAASAEADEAAAAVVFAEQSPAPTVESIMDDVYWEVDNKTAAGATGRHFFND